MSDNDSDGDSKYVHLEYNGEEKEQYEQLRAIKKSYGITWKDLAYIGAISLDTENELDDIYREVGEAVLDAPDRDPRSGLSKRERKLEEEINT